MGVWRCVSQHLITTAVNAKGKCDDWWWNGLSDASVARPFLSPFLPCATILPRKCRRGSGLATQGYSDASSIQTLKAENLRNRSIASAFLHSYTTDALIPLRTIVLRLMRAYLVYGYGRTLSTDMGVPRLRVRTYLGYGYRRTTTVATGECTGVLR